MHGSDKRYVKTISKTRDIEKAVNSALLSLSITDSRKTEK